MKLGEVCVPVKGNKKHKKGVKRVDSKRDVIKRNRSKGLEYVNYSGN